MPDIVLGARETEIKIQDLHFEVMLERGNRHKDRYKYILLSCMLAVITKHNRNRGRKAPDEPEAIGTASEKNHT